MPGQCDSRKETGRSVGGEGGGGLFRGSSVSEVRPCSGVEIARTDAVAWIIEESNSDKPAFTAGSAADFRRSLYLFMTSLTLREQAIETHIVQRCDNTVRLQIKPYFLRMKVSIVLA
jgi:hypothetical protein